jgi:hypothetical protein
LTWKALNCSLAKVSDKARRNCRQRTCALPQELWREVLGHDGGLDG